MIKALRFFDETPIHDSPAPVEKVLSLSLYLHLFLAAFFVRQPWGLILAALVLIRAAMVNTKIFISERLVWILTIAALIFIPTIFHRRGFNGFDDVGSAIALMALVRSARLKTSADARYLLILLILLSSAFALALPTPWVGVVSMLLFILNVGCLLGLHARGLTWADLAGSLKMFLLALAYATPMMLLYLVLLQHATHQLASYGNGSHEMGFTTQMEPGEVANLTLRSETAYRIKAEPELPKNQVFFWRVATLVRSNGLEWDHPDFEEGHLNEDDVAESCRVIQKVTPVGEEENDYPVALDPQINLLNLFSKTHEVASSSCPKPLHSKADVQTDEASRNRYLKVDFTPTPRIQKLVEGFKASSHSNAEIIKNVLQFFLNGSFRLTLQPKRVTRGPWGLNDFLFRTHEGFCEHYAGAFASLLRLAGVPARVVVGYKGGTRNPFGGYWRLAYSDAHAWTEVWDGSSWLRIDPTELLPPVSSPHDILTRALERLWLASDGLAFIGDEFAIKIREFLTAWKWRLTGVLAILLLGVFGYLSRRRVLTPAQRFENAFAKLCKSLAKKGLKRSPSEGYETFRLRLVAENSAVINEAFTVYIQQRYGKSSPDEGTIERVITQLKSIERTLQ